MSGVVSASLGVTFTSIATDEKRARTRRLACKADSRWKRQTSRLNIGEWYMIRKAKNPEDPKPSLPSQTELRPPNPAKNRALML